MHRLQNINPLRAGAVATAALAAVAGTVQAGTTTYRFTAVERSEDPSFVESVSLNDRGDVAYAIDATPTDLDRRTDLFLHPSGGSSVRVATHTREAAPAGLNNAGKVAFTSAGGPGTPDVVFRTVGPGEAAVRIAGSAETGMPKFISSGVSVNNSGTVAFAAYNASAEDHRDTVFAGSSQSNLRTVATLGERFNSFGFDSNVSPRIDDAGNVLFTAGSPARTAPDGTKTVTGGLYLDKAGGGAPVAIEEHTSPLFGAAGTGVSTTAMSQNGTVAYVVSDFVSGAQVRKTLYTWRDGERRTVVDTENSPFVDLWGISVNNDGEVAFQAQLPPPEGLDEGESGKWGIYLGPDAENDKLIAEGDTLFGQTVSSLLLSPYAFNNRGQIAFVAHLTSETVLVLADPVGPVPVPLPAALPAGLAGLGVVAGGMRLRRRRC